MPPVNVDHLNKVAVVAYRLMEPFRFDEQCQLRDVVPGDVLVRPTMASVCAADVRYYTGSRRPEALRKKLPMALIHEAVGVVNDPLGSSLARGQRVVMVPNIPGYIHSPDLFAGPDACCRACGALGVGENHCANCRFVSSGYDGFLMDQLLHPMDCLVPIPEDVPDDVAVLSELVTVAYNAAKRVRNLPANAIFLILGDGPVGYLMAVILQQLYRLERERLYVVGLTEEKLKSFDFATTICLPDDPGLSTLPAFDVGFECVGGAPSMQAINDAIRCAQPGAELFLLGVSEEFVPLNTRDILEKGMTLHGVSRSPRQDYAPVLELMRHSVMQERLRRVLTFPRRTFSDVESLVEIFEAAAQKSAWGKVVFDYALSAPMEGR